MANITRPGACSDSLTSLYSRLQASVRLFVAEETAVLSTCIRATASSKPARLNLLKYDFGSPLEWRVVIVFHLIIAGADEFDHAC
mgnify:CR=1 FL=1